jgi:hypothetical protein
MSCLSSPQAPDNDRFGQCRPISRMISNPSYQHQPKTVQAEPTAWEDEGHSSQNTDVSPLPCCFSMLLLTGAILTRTAMGRQSLPPCYVLKPGSMSPSCHHVYISCPWTPRLKNKAWEIGGTAAWLLARVWGNQLKEHLGKCLQNTYLTTLIHCAPMSRGPEDQYHGRMWLHINGKSEEPKMDWCLQKEHSSSAASSRMCFTAIQGATHSDSDKWSKFHCENSLFPFSRQNTPHQKAVWSCWCTLQGSFHVECVHRLVLVAHLSTQVPSPAIWWL